MTAQERQIAIDMYDPDWDKTEEQIEAEAKEREAEYENAPMEDLNGRIFRLR